MGSGASVPNCDSLCAAEIGSLVESLGEAYAPYKENFISNGICGEVVKDTTVEELDELFECLGIENKMHRRVLKTKFKTLKNGGNSAGGEVQENESAPAPGPSSPGNGASTVEHDITIDTNAGINRSPRAILQDIFAIQGIPLDPADVETTVNKIKSVVGEGNAGGGCFDCFISYRVASDADLAEKMFLYLKACNINAFLDKKCLRNGESWKEGFLQGLKRSRTFVALISKKALSAARDETLDHSHDNVLLEYETALTIKNNTGNKNFICPVHVGEYTLIPDLQQSVLVKFADFKPTLYADTVSGIAPPKPPDARTATPEPKKQASASKPEPTKSKPEPTQVTKPAASESVATAEQPTGTVSRYNKSYYCAVSAVSVMASSNTLTLTFNLRGDMSLGRLQNPSKSKLHIAGSVITASSCKAATSDNYQITGFLSFVVNPISKAMSNAVEFECAESGYSRVGLKVPGNTIVVKNVNPKCTMGHNMVVSDYAGGGYKYGWSCNLCGESGKGSRWFCQRDEDDYCFNCRKAPIVHPKCTKGHEMKNFGAFTFPKAYSDAFSNPAVHCDVCKKKRIHTNGYYHCGSEEYDMCLECAFTQCQSGTSGSEQLCDKGHKLEMYSMNTFPKAYRKFSSPTVHCDGCGLRNIERINSYYHCPVDETDFCSTCGPDVKAALNSRIKCNSGHKMDRYAAGKLPEKYLNMGYSSPIVNCDSCKRKSIHKETYYHCDKDDTDYCVGCAKKKRR